MASITLDRLRKEFAGGSVAARDVSLEIADGELMVLVGPSGSGKSTVLRLIAGLEAPTSGRVLIDGVDVTLVGPQQRDLAMVFQSYALYPHLSVRENLAFGLRMRRVPRETIAARIGQAAAILGLEALLDRKPAQLSGGQRQRVAVGRAIVREPRAFLFDEPLSNLDPALRADTRAELARLHRRLNATMVYVTHDQEEAMTLGTRIAVMRDGALEQAGPPLQLFQHPANAFVAGFVGSPAMNLLRCTVDASQAPARARCGPTTLVLDGARLPAGPIAETLIGVRPHDVALVPSDQADAVGHVEVLEPLGSTTLLHVRLDGPDGSLLRVVVSADAGVTLDERVPLRLRRDRLHLFDSVTGARHDLER